MAARAYCSAISWRSPGVRRKSPAASGIPGQGFGRDHILIGPVRIKAWQFLSPLSGRGMISQPQFDAGQVVGMFVQQTDVKRVASVRRTSGPLARNGPE